MPTGPDVPELLFARIADAAGPYSASDRIAVAFSDPTVGRLVAIDAPARARCANFERTAVPEIVSAIVEHPCAPYVVGETLTLYFVDPGIARIQRATMGPLTVVERTEPLDGAAAVEESAASGESAAVEDSNGISTFPADVPRSPSTIDDGEPMTRRADDSMTDARAASADSTREVSPGDRSSSESAPHKRLATEPAPSDRPFEVPIDLDRAHAAMTDAPNTSAARKATAVNRPRESDPPAGHREREAGITVRLEWSAERVRRFIAVVDRLFTIDRLGWYRHSLAMRLLIPDEIRSGDELADVEAMRHLHALRAAAVSALGNPLLAACMPGFTVTSDWLETLESSREARAIAGLRDALLPYATDRSGDDRSYIGETVYTVGFVGKRALLADSATSVESFLPILIPTVSHDAALCARFTEYRNLLSELFGQTARATDPVRLGALAQPNHSLDDRLWQLVGAVGETFGGFVQT